MEDGAKVEYSVKDRLAIQDKSLERIESKLDEFVLKQVETLAKLDTRVALLEARPDLETRVRSLEEARSEGAGERAYKRFFWGALGLLVGALWWVPHSIKHLFH